MDRHSPRDVIDLLSESEEEGGGGGGGGDVERQDDSDNFFFDDFLNEDVSGVHIAPVPSRTPDPYSSESRALVSPYEQCLTELLEVFPDISRDHVQSLYNGLDHQNGLHVQTAAQILIDKVLDGGKYPKEKDRIKELKRKRSDKNNDEEEAARWKYADMRDNPSEYSKVA